MNSCLSTLFSIAAAVLGVATFAYLFGVRTWNFLPSVGMSVLLAGGLFAISIFFDRVDARLHRRPYKRIFPRQLGVLSFLFGTVSRRRLRLFHRGSHLWLDPNSGWR